MNKQSIGVGYRPFNPAHVPSLASTPHVCVTCAAVPATSCMRLISPYLQPLQPLVASTLAPVLVFTVMGKVGMVLWHWRDKPSVELRVIRVLDSL